MVCLRFGLLLMICGALPGRAWASPPTLELAWHRGGSAEYLHLPHTWRPAGPQHGERLPSTLTTSLGSLWKLFVYAYLVETGQEGPAFVCTGTNASEEAFCCNAGDAIGRDEALARSCSLFFDPARLRITPDAWRAFWQPLAPASATWLTDLTALRPDTQVTVSSLLEALSAIPPLPRQQAEYALLGTLLSGRAEGTVPYYGSRLRVKTWTWSHPTQPGLRVGGFAGWLADGTPIWARAEGTSAQVLRHWAPVLSAWLDALPDRRQETECVMVTFFANYPVVAVVNLTSENTAEPGPLDGRYRVAFRNGNQLTVRSEGELALLQVSDSARIVGQFGLNDYVARVLDREAAASPPEAAKALAVAVRTYVLRHGTRARGCYEIDDSSRTQRVSPNPPTAAARKIAAWTDGLVIAQAPVTYHRDRPEPNRLAWTQAVGLAQEGQTFDQVLAAAYPGGALASMYGNGEGDCQRMPSVERWLKERAPRWRQRLTEEAGFEPPPPDLTVCRLLYGNPFFDFDRRRIYMRGLQTSNDRIAIAHEYVHLAFHAHPRGMDEGFVERLARELVGE